MGNKQDSYVLPFARNVIRRVKTENGNRYTETLDCGHSYNYSKGRICRTRYVCEKCKSERRIDLIPPASVAYTGYSTESEKVSGVLSAAEVKRITKSWKSGTKCLCGCNGTPSGGYFLPGHDMKLKSKIRRGEPVSDLAATYAKEKWMQITSQIKMRGGDESG